MKNCMMKLLLFMMIFVFTGCSTAVDKDDAGNEALKNAEDSELQDVNEISDSPEKAIDAFINAVKSGDLDLISDSFALDDFIEGYDDEHEMAQYVEKPTKESRLLVVYEQIMAFYVGFAMTLDSPSVNMENVEGFGSADVEKLLEPEKYESLEVMRVDLPEQDVQIHAERIAEKGSNAELFGADGRDYRVVLLKLDGETFLCGFQFLVYEGQYEIFELSCPVLGIDSRLATVAVSEEEYLGVIGGA